MNCGALNSTAEQPATWLVPGILPGFWNSQSVTVTADIHDSLTENIQYWEIYTTIGSLSAKICPQNLTNFKPGARNSTPIIASICMRIGAYMLPIRDIWTDFCDLLSFVFYVLLSFVFYGNLF